MARVKHISSVESDHCFVLTQLRQAGRQSINAQSYFGMKTCGKLTPIMMSWSRIRGSKGLASSAYREWFRH
jgi:hypothetical protein